jgi:glycerophosphoryl diester phosphodiesterase
VAGPLIWSHRGNADVDTSDAAVAGPGVSAASEVCIRGGGRSKAPAENSLSAFELVSALGVDGVETDTWLTADGEFVVVHDRATPAGPVDSLRRSQLPQLPSLAEVLSAAQVGWVNVELKVAPGTSRELARALGSELATALTQSADLEKLVVSSFSMRATDGVLAKAPFLRVGHLCEKLPDDETLSRLARAGYWGVHPWVGSLDPGDVSRAHFHGLAVAVWTVNDVEAAQLLALAGADVVITDKPVSIARGVRGTGPIS